MSETIFKVFLLLAKVEICTVFVPSEDRRNVSGLIELFVKSLRKTE